MRFIPTIFAMVVALPLASLFGCADQGVSQSRGNVGGEVKLNGEPVTAGRISFASVPPGTTGMATLQADGTYQVKMHDGDGLPVGEYQVNFLPPINDVAFGALEDPAPSASQEFKIPEKYRTAKSSGLTISVTEGENSPFNFDL